MVTSHRRPTEGEYNEEFSLLPVVNYLKDKLSNPVRLVKDYTDGVEVAAGELVVLENVRFNKGEKKDDEALSKIRGAVRRVRHGRLRYCTPCAGLYPRYR